MDMIKYQVRVEESVVRWVRVEAARRGVSQGEVLRRLVELHRELLQYPLDAGTERFILPILEDVGLEPVEE